MQLPYICVCGLCVRFLGAILDNGGHRRPELENDSIKIHALGDIIDFRTKYLQSN